MGEIELLQEQMKADMEALKDQVASMMEVMLSMKRMMENNVAAVAATTTAAEVVPTHPSTINQANQPIPGMVGQGGEVLGSTGGPHMGHNRNAYPLIIRRLPCTCPMRMLIMPDVSLFSPIS